MATAIEIYAGDFLRLFEAQPNIKLCYVCNRQFNRTAYYEHLKRNIHFAAPYKMIAKKINEKKNTI